MLLGSKTHEVMESQAPDVALDGRQQEHHKGKKRYTSGDRYRFERERGNISEFQPYLWSGGNWESQDSVDYTSKKAQEKVSRKCLNIPG